jgi:hypothetical protein
MTYELGMGNLTWYVLIILSSKNVISLCKSQTHTEKRNEPASLSLYLDRFLKVHHQNL